MKQTVASAFEEAFDAGFSGAARVTVHGTPILARGYGRADREANIDNTPDTAFDVGSLMKTMTAAAIFKLDDAGDLSIDGTLTEVLPNVPPDKAGITLIEILQHRAGFDEYHDTEGDFEEMTRVEARERILAQELLFEPGTDEAYSNSGFTLLADIVETISGRPFTEFVRAQLLKPAHMQQSGFYSDGPWQTTQTAIGYGSESYGANDPASWPYTWALIGNGGLVSTVNDLDRWLVALENGEVLAPSAFEKMRSQYLDPGAATVDGDTVYSGAGAGDFGLGGVIVDVPAQGARIVIASNAYDDFDVEGFTGDLIVELLDWE